MSIDYTIIGDRLKKARLSKGITQEVLAEKLNLSVAFLSRVERGRSQVNLKRLNELCSILGVSEGYVLNGASNKSSSYLNSEFNTLLKSCPPEKVKMIYEVAKTIIEN